MKQTRRAIEGGLRLYETLMGEQPALVREFEDSRADYFAAGTADRVDAPMAARRHLEWFLLERPSDHLGGVPAEALHAEWIERAEAEQADHAAAFLQSLAGAFEITSSEPGNGVWVQDLFGLGEYPIEEAEAAPELLAGDLLVGRLFPVGDGLFRLSPAVSLFRNPDLVQAVRADLERMRAARRGVLRIQQIELERLFFAGPQALPDTAPDAPPIDLAAERARAREALLEAGLDQGDAEEVLHEIRTAVDEGRPVVTDVLNALAFGTEVDLTSAQRTLAELWAVETHAQEEGRPAGDSPGDTPGDTGRDASGDLRADASTGASSAGRSQADVAAALAEFDRGRRKGEDLDALFRQLSDDLGLEGPGEEDDETTLPDFPGVVGALVEEFLWDVGRERGNAEAERLSGLRRLSRYGASIGLFEDLDRRILLDFAGRWLLDEGEVRGPEEARVVLQALREFCRWAEDGHGHPLASECDAVLERLESAVPRLVLARQSTAKSAPGDAPWEVTAIEAQDALLRGDDGRERRLRLPDGLAGLLRAGDQLHAREVEGRLTISACYPAELRQLLDREST